jgi:hypothetical protein
MSISIIKDNTVWYPKSIYYKYNVYLIEEYKKFLENTELQPVRIKVEKIINELEELLYDNTVDGDPNLPLPVTKIFNVMEWEENLIHHFDVLDASVKHRNENSSKYKGSMPIKTIMYFLRKEKLEKLNSL